MSTTRLECIEGIPREQSDALIERLDKATDLVQQQSEELRKLRSEKSRWSRREHTEERDLAGVSLELVVSQLKLLAFYEKEGDELRRDLAKQVFSNEDAIKALNSSLTQKIDGNEKAGD